MTDLTTTGDPADEVGPQTEALPPDVAETRATAFRALWTSGRPVSVPSLAEMLPGRSAESIGEDLRWLAARGRARLDDGEVVGTAGLSAAPTRHRLTVAVKQRFTWCAIDALGILAAGRFNGTLHSTPPGGDRPVVVVFRDGSPAVQTAAAVFIAENAECASVVDDWCPIVNLFPDRAAALAWQAEAGVTGAVVDVAEAATQAAPGWRLLLP